MHDMQTTVIDDPSVCHSIKSNTQPWCVNTAERIEVLETLGHLRNSVLDKGYHTIPYHTFRVADAQRWGHLIGPDAQMRGRNFPCGFDVAFANYFATCYTLIYSIFWLKSG